MACASVVLSRHEARKPTEVKANNEFSAFYLKTKLALYGGNPDAMLNTLC
jgi:hypothetical protein